MRRGDGLCCLWIEGAGFFTALVVEVRTGACDGAVAEGDPEVFLSELDGLAKGKVGVAFAATRAAVFADCRQGACGHLIGKAPCGGGEWG